MTTPLITGVPGFFCRHMVSEPQACGDDVLRGLSSAGVSWSFKAEAAAAKDNLPTIVQPEVPTHRADVIPFYIEIGSDWPGSAGQMSTLPAEGDDELLAVKRSIRHLQRRQTRRSCRRPWREHRRGAVGAGARALIHTPPHR